MMEPLSSFAISVIANIATSGITILFQKGLEAKVKDAYVRALKRWTKHDVDWESRKFKERLVDLADYMINPQGKTRYSSDIELLDYYKEELRKDPEVWSVIEESLLTYIADLVKDTNHQLAEIKSFLDECKVSQKELEDNIRRLLDLQLRRNVSSGKYLEDTYLEVDVLKERLRFFVDPNLFIGLTRERVARLNFDDLRWKLSEKGEGVFEFDVTSVTKVSDASSFELLYEVSRRLSMYLGDKYEELRGGGNTRYFQSRKIQRIKDLNDCHYKRVFILTSKAGQGKTNVLCDLTKNVLLKRSIPAVYLNGYEIDANNVEGSFSRKLFPTKNYSLDDILQAARCYCEQRKIPFVFIIDGLNENAFPRELRASVESFLCTVLQYDFVKVIMSCRTEYYDLHFKTVGKLLEEDTILQKDINSRLRDDWTKLKELYFEHFSIDCQKISEGIKDEFCENLLLFRIFCEVNRGKQLYTIYSIAKDPLFDSYCELMINRVASELKNEGYEMASEAFITGLLQDAVGTMVSNETFTNLPLKTIYKGTDVQQLTIVNRFLDNNVLVRKDLMSDNKSPFKNSEVVNFTFDEFRDYLVAHYLIDKVLLENQVSFRDYVVRFTGNKHLLSEGLTTFLFSYAKRMKNAVALDVLKSQQWYNPVFKELIWDLEDDCIDSDDVNLIKEFLVDNDVTVSRCLVYWGRWNSENYKKLNIKLLLEYLSSQNLSGLRNFFDKVWPNVPEKEYHWLSGRQDPSPREVLLNQIRELFESTNGSFEHKEQINLFELVLYLAAIDSSARLLYGDFLDSINDTEQVNKVMRETHCEELYKMAKQWL